MNSMELITAITKLTFELLFFIAGCVANTPEQKSRLSDIIEELNVLKKEM